MRRLPRIGLGLAFALGAMCFAPSAGAHALLRSSDPPADARLDKPPAAVVITFTETPEPGLSNIRVVDSSGRAVRTGAVTPVPGSPLALKVSLPELDKGIYTVAWRAYSHVDGHSTAGNFAFGVGISPMGASQPSNSVEKTPPASSEEIVGRWILDLGVIALTGGAAISALAFVDPPKRIRRFLFLALMMSFAGLSILGHAQLHAAGVGWSGFVKVFVGKAVVFRGATLVAAVALVVAGRREAAAPRRTLHLAVAAAGAVLLLVHSAAGHAAASNLSGLEVALQWVHLMAVSIWIGGLAALIVGIKGEPEEQKADAVRRFSLAAGFAVFVVVGTGVLRAFDSMASWKDLFTTTYGIAVTTKSLIWIALAILGARNRYRHVPAARTSLKGLRRVAKVELVLATVAICAAAMLGSVSPTANASTTRPVHITLASTDFATSIKARLEIAPGKIGPNLFRLTLADYDSGKPLAPTAVTLRFNNLDDPQLGESTLELKAAEVGIFEARGPNLSVPGRWRLIALVQKAHDSTEIDFDLATDCGAKAQSFAGQPTIYTVTFPGGGSGGGSAQGYLDPGKPGFNEVHITFFDAKGGELAVDGANLTASKGDAANTVLPVRRFGPGHFVADAQLDQGRWRIDWSTQATQGAQSLGGCFEASVPDVSIAKKK
jgi:copper transport protein